jgi:signal transduction histidine kinase
MLAFVSRPVGFLPCSGRCPARPCDLRHPRRELGIKPAMTDNVLHRLQERVKELTALHGTARILQVRNRPLLDVLRDILALLPPAWQYPETTVARIRFHDYAVETAGFRETPWRQSADFTVRQDRTGGIDVCYLEPRPAAAEGPFLKEERDLIVSLAEMLRSSFEQRLADDELQRAHAELEALVAARTTELRTANLALQRQVAESLHAQAGLDQHRRQLRQLASELSLAEARERRRIAEDLHDHIGQALAFIKINVAQLRGNAIFCGFESTIDEMIVLLDQTIRYTRNLTVEISPPALYELGFAAAIDGLAERFKRTSGLAVTLECPSDVAVLPDPVAVLLYKSIQELLTNVTKHARARRATVCIERQGDRLRVEVCDDGHGFDPLTLDSVALNDHFGLFSIRERLGYLGGTMEVHSTVGGGTTVVLLTPIQP